MIARLGTGGVVAGILLPPLLWHVCVLATWDRATDQHTCALDGYIRKDKLLQLSSFVPGRRGPWQNLELEDCHLEPMPRLVEAISLRKKILEVT